MNIVHLPWQWDGVAWDWVFAAALVAIGWLLGRFGAVANRRTEESIDRGWTRLLGRFETYRGAQVRKRTERAAAEQLSSIKSGRVGRIFIRHVTPNDAGMIGTVVALDDRNPAERVLTRWFSPSKRVSQDGDYPTDRPIVVEWKVLVRPPAEQLHWTARILADSHADSDGWVEFESFQHGEGVSAAE